MGRILITGSADGLGQLAAKALIGDGHTVVLHARNAERAREAMKKNPGADSVLTGDLSDLEETIQLGHQANGSGAFDAVIHNAGVYKVSGKLIFSVNTIAPYILTCLIQQPKRLIYLSSGMHKSGRPNLVNLKSGSVSYADSKLHVLLLCKSVARKWPTVYANAVDPGWVPTKMGGHGAPDDLQKGYETQVWLASANDEKVKVSGRYFFHQQEKRSNPDADDVEVQEKFLNMCKEITGITFPD
jgi:NAD(P)-dependent dehydrogenase (short-subunit alcohol dehydrogenase family)